MTEPICWDGEELVSYHDGMKVWTLNNQYHRLDGPAIEWESGKKEWYQKGQCHRIDGPAVIYSNDFRIWYLWGYMIPYVLTTVDGLPVIFEQIVSSREDYIQKYPSYTERFRGFYLDKVDLTLFGLDHEVVEMPYE